MLKNISTLISTFLVFGFALFQLLLTLGVPIGNYALGGAHRVLPARMRLISGFFAGLWSVVGWSYLQNNGIVLPVLNATFVNVLLVIYTLFLAYSIVGNGFITKSKKEKYLMTPLSMIGFISGILVLLG